MRSTLYVSSALCISAALAFGGGCSSSESDIESTSDAVTSAEIAQARAAIALIAGANAKCNQCHTASKADVQRWGTTMKQVETDCLAPALGLTTAQRLACISEETDSAGNPTFSAGKLGLYAAGARSAQFKALFVPATGATAADNAAWEAFQASVAMPKGTNIPPMTDAEFAKVKKWVLAGMPALDVALTDPDLGPCQTSLTPAVAAHVGKMKTEGWGARLADAATPMFGCGEGSGLACLSDLADVSATWSAPGSNQTLRKLREFTFKSHWWIRSSPDGRFAGFGLNTSAKLIDLSKDAPGGVIEVKASYDPLFFPNNEGFSFAGVGSQNGPIKVCRQSVLSSATNLITLNEPGCSTIISSVYQTVGAALDNRLYLMSTGTHVNDDAEGTGSGPRPGFDGAAKTILTPMVSDGNTFVPQKNIELPLPFEGDQGLSPSNTLLLTRFGSATGKRGYRIRKLDVKTNPAADGGAATYSATSDIIGTVCVNGAKPAMSFDERFIVSHQYVDPNASEGLPAKSANIVLVDLLTGEVVRLTTMKDRQYAFAPHFRADGWIYFVVRDLSSPSAPETLVASDAALRRMGPPASTH